jgi:hypothetical protein
MVLACVPSAFAQGSVQQATHEEVLRASLSAVNGDENAYPMNVSERNDSVTGETIRTFTFTGPADEANGVFAQCHIRMQKEAGVDRDRGIVRQVVDSTPVCGAQYTSMRDVINVTSVEASFSVREYSFE